MLPTLLNFSILQGPSETAKNSRYAQDIKTCESDLMYEEKPHKKDGSTFRPLRGLRSVEFGIKDGHFRVDSRLEGHPAWREIQIKYNVKYQNYHYYIDSLLVSFLQVMASSTVQGTTLTPMLSFSTKVC